MATNKDAKPGVVAGGAGRFVVQALACVGLAGLTAASAILVKEHRAEATPLAAVDLVHLKQDGRPATANGDGFDFVPAAEPVDDGQDADEEFEPAAAAADPLDGLDDTTLMLAADANVRWFNGRPVRPVKQYWMTVTGYSPDERSCGDSADGLTATLHSVQTNNFKLVAADTRVLPYGSMVSVPGYHDAQIVPVLDCGGAIKGRKLDLLYPTHEQAMKWGRKKVLVTVWGYADGKPAENPRKVR